ncbi:hypothetical protein ElyMa_001142200 [Elysia marginata]|uniref:ABC transmembrane type-1 domain-containing protein n=1 Tax=Elysia marginata TaxID=1093978 RepID=A0AAV4HZL0_9GAST|nr:hypothetical protein ElyMa_001142200 [Elysia marginata]
MPIETLGVFVLKYSLSLMFGVLLNSLVVHLFALLLAALYLNATDAPALWAIVSIVLTMAQRLTHSIFSLGYIF